MHGSNGNPDEIYLYRDDVPPDFEGKVATASRPNDAPLRPGLLASAEVGELLGLEPCRSRRVTDARRCLLGNLLSLNAEEEWVFYSRDNNYY